MQPRSRSRPVILALILSLAVQVGFALQAQADDQAPDPTAFGPLNQTSAEYKFPAAVDPDVIGDRATELWARVYHPDPLPSDAAPVVIFLHGNHGTCGHGQNPRIDDSALYTTTGTCPPGYVVTPNHLGYAYIAEVLASWGYVVVSINANRGITAGAGVVGDLGLNLARGRLVLKHLQRLSEWNRNGGTPASLGIDLEGKLDFSQLGLLGHSRGGEGVRAAYNQYRDPGSPWPGRIPDPLTVRGIFEIGPVDGQTSRVLNADGTAWNVLLPMCDGDVFNLQGVKPFDRMMQLRSESPATQKSAWVVWGANHNFYNTEWQVSDSGGCQGHTPLFTAPVGSPQQRTTGLEAAMAFFRGNVRSPADGNSLIPQWNWNFRPEFLLPDAVTQVTRVNRSFTDSPNSSVSQTFEDFDQPAGTNSFGVANDASGITITHGSVPEEDPSQRAASITWQAGGDATFFQTNWRPIGTGADITGFQTLDLRLSRQVSNLNPADPLSPTDFSVQLVQNDGKLSDPVLISNYTNLLGPVGSLRRLHVLLQTARIMLTDFPDVDLSRIRGIRLTFDQTASGAIFASNFRLSNSVEGPGSTTAAARPAAPTTLGPLTVTPQPSDQVTLVSIRRPLLAAPTSAASPSYVFTLSSLLGFPIRDELIVMRVGAQTFPLSATPTGDPHTMTFSVTSGEWDAMANGDPISVQFGMGADTQTWAAVGPLDKSLASP